MHCTDMAALTVTLSVVWTLEWTIRYDVTVTVTVTINGLVKLSAFNAHICPCKYLASF